MALVRDTGLESPDPAAPTAIKPVALTGRRRKGPSTVQETRPPVAVAVFEVSVDGGVAAVDDPLPPRTPPAPGSPVAPFVPAVRSHPSARSPWPTRPMQAAVTAPTLLPGRLCSLSQFSRTGCVVPHRIEEIGVVFERGDLPPRPIHKRSRRNATAPIQSSCVGRDRRGRRRRASAPKVSRPSESGSGTAL